jgi:hypothetical protein
MWMLLASLGGCIRQTAPAFEPPVPSHLQPSDDHEIRGAVFAYQLTKQHWPLCASEATQTGIYCLRADNGDPDPEMLGMLHAQTPGVRRASDCDAKHGEAMHEHKTGKTALLLMLHSIEHQGQNSATVYGRYHAGGRCWATYYYHLERAGQGWEVTLATEDISG